MGEHVEKRKSTRFLKRYLIESDNHKFIGRVYDLSIISFHFETYEELINYDDARYVFHVNHWLSTMTRRIESMNRVADMLWLERQFFDERPLAISRYDWANIAADAFLMRFISISDGAIILTNEVFEVGLEAKDCTIKNLKKASLPKDVLDAITQIVRNHQKLRSERNSRFHHGVERELSSDDHTFLIAALFEKNGNGIRGEDRHGRRISLKRYLKEALVELQRDFNASNRKLASDLDRLYGLLEAEFESRFRKKFYHPTRGYGSAGKRTTAR